MCLYIVHHSVMGFGGGFPLCLLAKCILICLAQYLLQMFNQFDNILPPIFMFGDYIFPITKPSELYALKFKYKSFIFY